MPNTATLINDACNLLQLGSGFANRGVNVYGVLLDGTGDLTIQAPVGALGVIAVLGFTVSGGNAGVFKLQSGTTGTTTLQNFHMAAHSHIHHAPRANQPYIHFMTNRTGGNDGTLVVAHSGAGASANVVRVRLWVAEVLPSLG